MASSTALSVHGLRAASARSLSHTDAVQTTKAKLSIYPSLFIKSTFLSRILELLPSYRSPCNLRPTKLSRRLLVRNARQFTVLR